MQRSTNRFSTGAEREAQTTRTQGEVRHHVDRDVLAVPRRKCEVPTCSVTSRIHFDRQLACRHSQVRPVACGSGRLITFTSRCQWQRAVSFCRPGSWHMHARQERKKKRRTDREAEAERNAPLQRKIMHENKQLQLQSDRESVTDKSSKEFGKG